MNKLVILLMVLIAQGISPSFGADYAVNNIKNLKRILAENGIKKDLTYSNPLTQSTRYAPYWEILYPDPSAGIFYDYVSVDNAVQSTAGADYYLDKEGPIALNDKRAFMFDLSIIENSSIPPTEQFPEYKYLSFKNPLYKNDGSGTIPDASGNYPTLNLKGKLKKVTTLSMSQSGKPYTETQVDRTSAFVYYPRTTMYLLMDTVNRKVYAMQTSSTQKQTGDDFYETNLVNIKQRLKLPPGWTFTVATLDSKTFVGLISNPEHRAKVIQDDLANSYQYVRPEEASFFYEGFQ